MLDYHIHSNFSFDSNAQPREICEAACSFNLHEIAITDHFSFAPYSPNYLHFEPKAYFQTWQKLQQEYASRLTLRIGVELDEFANFPLKSNQLVQDHPWDFIIGSTHDLEGGTLRSYLRKYGNQEKAARAYYTAVLASVEAGEFDVLAHFDLIKRYITDEGHTLLGESLFHDQIDAIFRVIIQKDMALEVNSSGLSQACGSSFPSTSLLRRYYQLGGRLITLGSDAHAPKDMGRGFAQTISQLQAIGFPGLVQFEQRKKRIVSW